MVESEENEPETWTRRMRLILAGVRPGARYNLPFFAHRALGNICFTSEDGKPLLYCEDGVYKADDHRLLWIGYDGLDYEVKDVKEEVALNLFLYIAELASQEVTKQDSEDSESCKLAPMPAFPNAQREEDIFLIADFFKQALQPDGNALGWTFHPEHVRPQRCLRIAEPPGEMQDRLEDSKGWKRPGNALRVDASTTSEVLLTRPLPLQRIPGRMQLRVHFWDCCEEGAHAWVGVTASGGAFAIGVHPHVPDHYACFCTAEADGGWGNALGWQKVKTSRSRGWHAWELVLQEKWLSFWIDGAIMGGMPAPVTPGDDEQICLGTSGKPCAYWGGVELLHTPFGDKRWESGVQAVHPERPFTWRPWRVRDPENGTWVSDGNCGILCTGGDNSEVEIAEEIAEVQEIAPLEKSAADEIAPVVNETTKPTTRSAHKKQVTHAPPAALQNRADRREMGNRHAEGAPTPAKAKAQCTWRPTL